LGRLSFEIGKLFLILFKGGSKLKGFLLFLLDFDDMIMSDVIDEIVDVVVDDGDITTSNPFSFLVIIY